MGLQERRAVQALKDGDFKQFTERVNSICGGDMPVEMDWSSFENDNDIIWILDNKKPQECVFGRLEKVLSKICGDDMGKSALKDKVKKISVINTSGDMEFRDGTFILRTALNGNGIWGEEQIQDFIEKQL